MIRKSRLKSLFYLNIVLVSVLIGYKVYLNLKQDFAALHTDQVLRLKEQLTGEDSFSFAVVGNINNSVGIFERTFIPLLNRAPIDFVVSAGNAVSGGGEDKYRALYGTLSKLDIPFLLTFGENEHENFGSFRFYDHFGPHLYSVKLGHTRLVFLDSTGRTDYRWQLQWLEDLLATDDARHTLLFSGHPVLPVAVDSMLVEEEDFLSPPDFQRRLLRLIREEQVDAVFSANVPVYSDQEKDSTRFITTGGAGGLILNDEISFYHYVTVKVTADELQISLQPVIIGQHPLLKQLESLWFFFYSLFYVGYLNFVLLLGVLMLMAIRLYTLVFIERDYYRDYDINPAPWLNKPLRVAMFTNNYLPFIGGVPISIDRLRRGLEARNNTTLIVAPCYNDQPPGEANVLRLPSLLSMGVKREFRLANIFMPSIYRQLRAFRPDIIHVHHPFWLGSAGLFLGRRLGVPVVFTYHTRLEHYAHFVPLPGKLFRNFISHALIKRFANRCDGIIVPTYSAEEYLRVIGVRKPTFVQVTGVEFERFQQVAKEDVERLRAQLDIGDGSVLISVSRLSNEKNVDFLVNAAAGLRATLGQPFTLLIIGDGHERLRLQQRIDTMGLNGCVRLLGSVPQESMPTYYRLGDIFVFASKSETQGMVILEAMAAGLPVVAIRSSGIDDVVQEGVNGFKTRENQAQWQGCVRRLVLDKDLRRELSEHALDTARDHSIEQCALATQGIYAELLAQFRS